MSSRYVTNAVIALAGGFVVVASRSFRPAVIGWIGFAFGIGIILISLLAQLDSGRGPVQRLMDVVMAALGGLAMGFGIAATGAVAAWTCFAFALGWVALAFSGLSVHEIATWRSSSGLARLHYLPASGPASPVAGADSREAPRDRQVVA